MMNAEEDNTHYSNALAWNHPQAEGAAYAGAGAHAVTFSPY